MKEVIGRAPAHGTEVRGSVLMIAANPAVSERTGWPIGCWAAELTHPFLAFLEAGLEVDLCSPDGGRVEFDSYSDPRDESGYSALDLVSLGFISTPSMVSRLEETRPLAEVDPTDYDALFLVGGQSPMFTFHGNANLARFVAEFHATGKPVAAVCHATCVLLDARSSDGELLVKNRSWTGFSDAEEQFADSFVGQKIQPFWIEEEARKIPDTDFRVQPSFTPYAIRDGNLITGQQQNSGGAAAGLLLEALDELSE